MSSIDPSRQAQVLLSTRALHVLIVDDIEINRILVSSVVEHWGHVAEQAADGQQAVDRVAVGGIDLVLMDVEMPGVDGFEATRLIRALPDDAGRTPVWALTCRVAEHDMVLTRQAGMDGHLCKPLDLQALQALLQSSRMNGRG